MASPDQSLPWTPSTKPAAGGVRARLLRPLGKLVRRFHGWFVRRRQAKRRPTVDAPVRAKVQEPVRVKAAAPPPASEPVRVDEPAPVSQTVGKYDRDNPSLEKNLQAVGTRSPAYGVALQALARLGTLDVARVTDAERRRAERELLEFLPRVGRLDDVARAA